MRRRLVILTHAHQGLDANAGIARLAADFWRPAGWEVLVQQGLENPPDSDIAILHVDLTVVPEPYIALARRYPVCLNGRVTDVSKRRISRDLVARGDAYDGPVMVKTDRNYGGNPERRLRLVTGGRWARWTEAVAGRLPCAWLGRLDGDNYPVFPDKAAVPAWVWRSPDLVVERFMAQREGSLYAVNQWQFLGDSGRVLTYFSDQPIVKYQRMVKQLPLHDEVPEEIRARRAELGFDYGKFDYVVTPEGPRLLDANRTPWTPRGPDDPRMVAMARGLPSFLR